MNIKYSYVPSRLLRNIPIDIIKIMHRLWFIVLLALASASASLAQKKCHRDCIKRGNCNAETGKCECPFGRTGEACEQDLLPACRATLDSPAYCGHVSLKSCDCIRQCHSYVCVTEPDGFIACETLSDMRSDRPCFERTRLGAAQTVDVPAEDEPDVIYYAGYRNGSQHVISYA